MVSAFVVLFLRWIVWSFASLVRWFVSTFVDYSVGVVGLFVQCSMRHEQVHWFVCALKLKLDDIHLHGSLVLLIR